MSNLEGPNSQNHGAVGILMGLQSMIGLTTMSLLK